MHFVTFVFKGIQDDRWSIFKVKRFLAHLWGAYAIPMALSGVRRPSSVVRRVSSVSTITTRNN